jgi:hypothetical protein
MLLTLTGSIGLALFLDGPARRLPRAVPVLLVVLALAEQLHVLGGHDEREYREAVERIAAEVDPACETFFVSTRVEEGQRGRGGLIRPRMTQIAAMWAALEVGLPTINGFSGNSPPGWNLSVADTWSPAMSAALERELERWVRAREIPGEVCRVTVPGDWLPWLRRAR